MYARWVVLALCVILHGLEKRPALWEFNYSHRLVGLLFAADGRY